MGFHFQATLVNCDVSLYVPEQRTCHKADDQAHMTSSTSEPTEQFDFEHGIIEQHFQPIPIVPNPDDSEIDSETNIKVNILVNNFILFSIQLSYYILPVLTPGYNI